MSFENTEAFASVSPCGNMLAVTSDGVTATIPLAALRLLDTKDRYRVAEFLTIQDLAAAAVARLVAECEELREAITAFGNRFDADHWTAARGDESASTERCRR